MSYDASTVTSPLARWSRNVGVFSVQVLLVAIVLHRFASLSTPVALNLGATALVGALLAILLAFGAYVAIWRDGRMGVGNATLGLILGLALVAWPVSAIPTFLSLPKITDVTTDTVAPPEFTALAANRPAGSKNVRYAGPAVATAQLGGYPDIRPQMVPRPVNETWEALGDTIRRLGWKPVREQPPQGPGRPGFIEATDRTMILGFTDDIVVRISGDTRETRVDMRSASRYGDHDFGRNAGRIRRLFKDLTVRLDETASGAERPRGRRSRPDAAVPRRAKGSPVASQGQSPKQGRAQRGSQRGPQQTAKQPAPVSDRARGKQLQQ